MRVLNPDLDLERFFARLAQARERLLLVDYDGTLAPFHPVPARALPYPQVERLLNEIGQYARTRVVMVSGRPLAALREPLRRIRSSEVWGAHGWQRRKPGGARTDYSLPAEARRALLRAEAQARTVQMYGARVERKHASVAVHWRGLADTDARAVGERLNDAWRGAARSGLEMLEFDGGVELRARGRNKGDVVKTVLADASPEVVCAYLGDDRADEDAFEAVKPRGLAVLVRPALRPTQADLWLEPPSELVEFLASWRACGAGA